MMSPDAAPRKRRLSGCAVVGGGRSFRWSFRQAQHRMTGPYRLDYPSDLTSENSTLRDDMDGGGSTSNP